MKTISVKDLRSECTIIAVVDLPQLAMNAHIFELKCEIDVRSFFVVLGSDFERKKIWEDVKLLTHLQFKKFKSGVFAGEKFLLDMSKQYSQTVDCKAEIEAILSKVVRAHLTEVSRKTA